MTAAAAPVTAGIWSHYDDDLLFAVPTLDRAIRRGHHVRNLFLTASDAGTGMSTYVTDRERGLRAAYDVMRGSSTPWTDHETVLSNGLAVTTTSPDDDPRIALTFLRLPDGGLTGGGWYATGYRTLPKLVDGRVSSLITLDTRQELTLDQLVSTIGAFVAESGASAVLTTMPDSSVGSEGDHPDHGGAGRLVAAAVDAGLVDGGIVRYAVGYPLRSWPANLDAADVDRKLDVFTAYAAHDAVVCRDRAGYASLPGFGDWLRREHHVDHRDLARVEVPR